MHIVHFGHSCVLLDTGSAKLLIDPGAFSTGFEGTTGLDVILVTHQHSDHLDLDRFPALVAANPEAQIVTDSASAEDLAGIGVTATVAKPGDALELGGAVVNVISADHEVIHPDFPVPPNVGYLVDHGAFYHPGDSLSVPEQKVDVLGLPTIAPWLKIAEAGDFLRAVAPRVAVPIHDELLATDKKPMYYGWFERLAPEGTGVAPLPHGEATEV
jgi:L-ascorbate metabolism protein UlaG (beta-lactamase superfamily)